MKKLIAGTLLMLAMIPAYGFYGRDCVSGCTAYEEAQYEQSQRELTANDVTYICQTADVVTTGIALAGVGLKEANPLMAGLLKAVGLPGLLVLKLAFAWWLNNSDVNETVKTTINTATCGLAVHNLLLIQ